MADKYNKIFNLVFPVVNKTTGNILNYNLNNIKVKRNVYIDTITVDNLTWRNGNTSTKVINYTFNPDDNNVDIAKVEYIVDDSIKSYVQVSSSNSSYDYSGGHFTVNIVKNVDSGKVSGNITVKVTDINGNLHTGISKFNLWADLTVEINVKTPYNDINQTLPEGSAINISQTVELNDKIAVTIPIIEGYTLNDVVANTTNISIANKTTTSFDVVWNGGTTTAEMMRITIKYANDETGEIFDFICGMTCKKLIPLTTVTADEIEWYKGNSTTISVIFDTNTNISYTASNVVVTLSSSLQEYLKVTNIVHTTGSGGSVNFNVNTVPLTTRTEGTYTIKVTNSKGQTASVTKNVILWSSLGTNMVITADNNTTFARLNDSSTGTDYSDYTIECVSGKSITFTISGYDSRWMAFQSVIVTKGSDVVSVDYKNKTITYLKDGSFSLDVNFVLNSATNVTYKINNVNIKKNVYINSLTSEDRDYMFYDSNIVSRYLYAFWSPANITVGIKNVTGSSTNSNIVQNGDYALGTYPGKPNSIQFPVRLNAMTGEKQVIPYTIKVTDEKNKTYTTTCNINAYNVEKKDFTFHTSVGDINTGDVNVNNYITSNQTLEMSAGVDTTFTVTVNNVGSIYKPYSIQFGDSTQLTSTVNGNVFTVTPSADFSQWTGDVVVTLKNSDNDDTVTYTINNMTVKTNIFIQSVSFDPQYLNRKGTFEIPLTITPANYTVDVQSVTATWSGTFNYANIKSANKDKIVVEVPETVKYDMRSNDLVVNVTDVKGNVYRTDATVNLYNSCDYVMITGSDEKLPLMSFNTFNPHINLVPGVEKTIYFKLYPEDTTCYLKHSSASNKITDSVTGITMDFHSSNVTTNEKYRTYPVVVSIPSNTTQEGTITTGKITAYNALSRSDGYGSSVSAGNFSPYIYLTADIVNKPTIEFDLSSIDNESDSYSYGNPFVAYPMSVQFKDNNLSENFLTYSNILTDYSEKSCLSNKIAYINDNIDFVSVSGSYGSLTYHYYAYFKDDINLDSQSRQKYNLYYADTMGDIYDEDTSEWNVVLCDTHFKMDISNIDQITHLKYPDENLENKQLITLNSVGRRTGKIAGNDNFTAVCFDRTTIWNTIKGGEKALYKNLNVNCVDFNLFESIGDIDIEFNVAESVKYNNCHYFGANFPMFIKLHNYVKNTTYGVNDKREYQKDITIDYTDFDLELYYQDELTNTNDNPFTTPIIDFDELDEDLEDTRKVNILFGDLVMSDEYCDYILSLEGDSASKLRAGSSVEYGMNCSPKVVECLNKFFGPDCAYEEYNPNKYLPFWVEVNSNSKTKDNKISFGANGNLKNKTVYYSEDNVTWKSFVVSTIQTIYFNGYSDSTSVTVSGNKVFLKTDINIIFHDNATGHGSNAPFYLSSASSNYNIGGNIKTLFNEDFAYNSQTYSPICCLYPIASEIKDASNLYVNKLNLRDAFYGCTSLTTPPDMSNVTSIGSNGCNSMFYNCTSLTTPPDMSNVTSIGNNGCESMFRNCTSLTKMPDLSNITQVYSLGCNSMFYNCTSLTEINTPKCNLYSNDITKSMFQNCTNVKNIHLYGYSSAAGNGTYDVIFENGEKEYRTGMAYFCGSSLIFGGIPNHDVNIYIHYNSNRQWPIIISNSEYANGGGNYIKSNWNIYILND